MRHISKFSSFQADDLSPQYIRLLQTFQTASEHIFAEYLVEERIDRPEYLLVLNKLLCGVQTGMPIIQKIEAIAKEQETIDGLLAAIIQHWGALDRVPQ